MISKCTDYAWNGVEVTTYKNEAGTWQDVTRAVLMPDIQAGFQVRYFEIAPGGYTSFEKHEHEHAVIVARGKGRVRLGDEWTEISENDAIRISSLTPHQFDNPNLEPFGIFCIVNSERDRPQLIDPHANVCTSE